VTAVGQAGPAIPARVFATTSLDDPVATVRLVDRTRAQAFGRLGVATVDDLLRHYPHRYLDLSVSRSIADLRPGEDVTVVGTVHSVVVKHPRPRLTVTEVGVVDATGVLLAVWFNQPYVSGRLREGERIAVAGTVAIEYGFKQMRAPFFEKLPSEGVEAETLGRILPVHRATEGLSSNWIRRLVREALASHGSVADPLPVEIRRRRALRSLRGALRSIHFPEDAADAADARRRLAYDELLTIQIGMALRRRHAVEGHSGTRHRIDGPAVLSLKEALPFELTADQRRATRDVLKDMRSQHPMNRMLLGDVGTGKTVVAAVALCAAADTGTQAAMMAPTEVLAAQYAAKVGPLLDAAGVAWTSLTGSTAAKDRAIATAAIADGTASVVFGTHALIQEGVSFAHMTLAIVDEQHRFGVAQRLGLRSKGTSPDLLVMSATPIPRSLALTLYGDLDASYIRERPGRGRVTTSVVPRAARAEAYERVREAVRSGHQAYVVCALVDESDTAQTRAAVTEARRLRSKVFPDLRVGLLTGQMRGPEKTAVMDAFRSGDVDVLVATTVIEVGVDVANATVMIVEDAERFGLAQLHQLRGRVGRGDDPGAALLFADPRSDEGRRRMEAIASIDDGFALAEADLRLRGEGQVLGERQHGLPELLLASVLGDADLLDAAHEDAAAIVAADPDLLDARHAPLLRDVRRRFREGWTWVSSG